MNKNLFRIIFNKSRHQYMAVAEVTNSHGGGSSGQTLAQDAPVSGRPIAGITTLALACMVAVGTVMLLVPKPVRAQVVAYRQAPSSQQPTILQTANGVPQVNIQTPSAAGVSRNIYSQFDVQSNGVIVNNSVTDVQTRQGGWVQGNPWLAKGSARVILNEINASKPSYLNGYLEVAGQRAEVVIANPSGISVNGGGFINTSKTTLTTGSPIVNNGNLDGYRVQDGNISIYGNGLDLSTTHYSAILARAMQVNAGIWANELKVVTGANQIDAASLVSSTTPITTSIAATGAVPSFALDVAQIGGMYAGKIHLIGTEQGLGVRSAGVIGSTGGDLVLQNNGWLSTTGTLQASANLQITAQGDVSNSGTLYASNNHTLSATGNVTNSGVIAAQGHTNIVAGSLSSSAKSILGAGVDAVGKLANSGDLSIATSQTIALVGQNLAAGNITLTGSHVDLSGSQTGANNISITANSGNIDTSHATVATSGASGVLAITAKTNNDQTLVNTQGVLSAGQLSLQIAHLNNAQGQITQTGLGDTSIVLTSPTSIFNNTGGTLTVNSSNLEVASNTLTNNDGKLQHAGTGTMHLTANTLNDQRGQILSHHALVIDAGEVDHRLASTVAKNITLSATSLNNTEGEIFQTGDGAMAIVATQGIDNTAGKLVSNGDLSINLNTTRTAGAPQDASVLSNLQGLVTAKGNVAIIAAGAGTVNNSGKLQAGNSLNLTANNVDNTATGEILANTTTVNANSTLTNRGLIDGVDTQVNANTVNNIGTGRIYGDHLSIAAVHLTNDTETIAGVSKAGTMAARERLDLGISGILTNRENALIYSVGNMAIGGALDTNRVATGAATTVNNNSATIEAGRNLSLSSGTVNNTNDHFAYEIRVATTELNIREDIDSGLYRVFTRTTFLPYQTASNPAQILAGGDISLYASNATNYASHIVAGGALNIGSSTLANTDVMATKSIRDVGTTYTLVHVPGSGICGKILIDCERAHDEWRTAPYDSSAQSTVSVAQITAPGSSGAQIAKLTGSSVNQTQATQDLSVRGEHFNTTLSTSSLFKNNPSPTSAYLIETDTRFIDRKIWLGSDYMTKSLSLDPTVTQKRLGDGFYEQKIIREQVAELTGRRFLADYTSDEQEYKALMDSGTTYAKQYNLRPGIALTAQQIAQLTSDIVWLVEQTVSLPDGSSQKVLVPQVYVKVQPGDLDGSGALLAGKDVNLDLSGDSTNSGTIAGRNVVSLNAENVNNLGGRMGGNDVSVNAKQDLHNIGGSMGAVNSLSATAGRDLDIQTTTQITTTQTGISNNARIGVDRVAGLYVSGANGTLVASAGQDLNIVAGIVRNAGNGTTSLSAGNNFTLGTVKTGEQNSIVWDGDNHLNHGNTQTVGSTISGGGNVNLKAGNDLVAKAANVQATKALGVQAGGSVSIVAGENNTHIDEAHQTSSGGGIFGGSTLVTRHTKNTNTAVASNFGGGTVDIVANSKDINVEGSSVVSDKVTNLTAGGNVNIEAATNTSQQSNYSKQTDTGFLSGGGLSISYGTRMQSTDGKDTMTTAAASTVGSVNGNVNITAGNQYKQVGSDVLTPNGDISIKANTVDIQEARETNQQSIAQKFEQSGVTLAMTSGLIDNLQGAQKQQQAASQTKDTRLKALAVANEVANVSAAAQNATKVDVSLSYGVSKSESMQTITSDSARGSTVKAGGNISIVATGGGENSKLSVQGSNINGQQISLAADNQVALLAASNSSKQTSTSSNSSASVGAGIGTSGLGVTASASIGKGNGNQMDTTYANTHIAGAESVNINSGSDTTLKGATVEGKQVTVKVGGNLNIESLRDTRSYTETSKQVGGSVMVGVAQTGLASGNVNQAKSNIDSKYASVGEQSGIKTGDGGFQVDVKGNTDLKGGAITSTQTAIDNIKNSFSTGGTLSTSNINNSASYNSNSVSVTVGTGSTPGQSVSAGMSGVGLGSDKGNTSSTTTASISGIAGDASKRTGDKEQGIKQIFKKDQVKAEIVAQTAITSEFAKNASKAVGDYAATQLKEAQAAGDAAGVAAWSEGGLSRLALHSVVGGLTFGTAGSVGAGTSQAAIGHVGQAIKDTDLPVELKQTLVAIAGTAIGAAASGGSVAGGAAALNATVNNYLLHNKLVDEEGELARLKQKKQSGLCDTNCDTRLCELQTLDKLRDEQLAPLVDACEKAGRKNCKGEAIAKQFSEANGFGAESMRRESNAGTLGSPFSFNGCPSSDKGGCSYGPLQIAADTGMMKDFIESLRKNPSLEAQDFYKELQAAGGVTASQNKDPAFIQTWMKLTAKDPQFVQYQIDALINKNLYPVVEELQKVGVDFNTLTQAQKEAIFSAAVQHGAGTVSKTKGADNVLERSISVAQTDAQEPSFPTYTRQELVYGQVEDQMRGAEESKAKLVTQQKVLVTQQRDLVTQQLNLERQKSQLLEQGYGSSSADIARIQNQVKALDQKIGGINEQLTTLDNKASKEDQTIQDAAQYLKSQAQGSLSNGEQWLKDFYQQRTLMYPAEAKRYQLELDSLLKQYREEKKAKIKK